MSEDDISRIYVIYRLFGFLFTALKSEHIWLLTEKTLIKTTVFLYKPGVTLLRKIFFYTSINLISVAINQYLNVFARNDNLTSLNYKSLQKQNERLKFLLNKTIYCL